MKWFKHQVTAHNDERLAALEDKCGLEGYGFYFKMLEIVAATINERDISEAEFSAIRWARQLNISTKKFSFLLQCAVDVGLMLAQCQSDKVLVKIPNLLKYRDNHTKNLQVTSKPRARVVDTEEDKDKERDKPPLIPPRGEQQKAPKADLKNSNLSRLALNDLPPPWAEWSHAAMGWDAETTSDQWVAFRDYWQAKQGKTACKSDWKATWRNWCRSAVVRPKKQQTPFKTFDELKEEKWAEAMRQKGYTA